MTTVNPPGWAPPRGYNNGVLMPAGEILFVAGQVGWTPEGRIVSPDFCDQFEQALANVVAVVEAAGGSPQTIGKLTLFVTDKTEYLSRLAEIGDRYRRLMGRHFPAMSLVEVKGLAEAGALVEIEAMAVLPGR